VASGRYNARCGVCQSPDRKILIETLLIRGVSAEMIAGKINEKVNGQPVRFISSHAIRRHRTHVPAALIEKLSVRALNGALANVSLETLKKQESEGLLQLTIGYRAQLDTLIDTAVFQNNLGAAASLIAKRNDLLTFCAKLLHEIGGSTTIVTNQNLLVSPAYLQLRTALMRALQGPQFSAARAAVAAALAEVETAIPIGETEAGATQFAAATVTPTTAPPSPPLQIEDLSDARIAKP
jgi:hypothetical protein